MTILRLKKGDLVVEKLTEFAQSAMKGGAVWGLGALEWASLKLYDLKTKKYLERKIDGPLEIGSLFGVIARLPDQKLGLHVHATVTDRDFKTYGGHLEEARVAATLEIVYLESKQEVTRYFDEEIGLNLLNI